MSYDINQERTYQHGAADVYQAVLGAVDGLEGKVLSQDEAGGKVEAKFDKKILGKVLGDRTQIQVDIQENNGNSVVKLLAYPIDPVGRKLMFGARKGVTSTVVGWFWAHLEHRLG